MYISIDIGGTNIRIAETKDLKNPKLSFFNKFRTLDNYEEDLKNIFQSIKSQNIDFEAIAIGLPEKISKDHTHFYIKKLKSWNKKNIIDDFKREFRKLIFVENDSVLAALGEATYSPPKEKKFIFLTWGTGVGGSIINIIENNKDTSITYTPLEPGHDIIIRKNGREGVCGHKGDLESYIGGASMKRYYKKEVEKLDESEWQEVVSYFSKGLKLVLKKYPVNLLIFGGGIALGQQDKVKKIEKELQKDFPKIKCELSKLGDNAGLYGGFALIKEKLGR